MRKPVSYRTGSRETYKAFCEQHPEIKLPFLEWQNILYAFNYGFRDYIMESGDRAKMPFGFGDFMIAKKKKKRYKTLPSGEQKINLSINWKATKENGKKIYHTNAHTEGNNFYIRWEHKLARFFNAHIWFFKPSRITSRLLAHYLKQENYQHKYSEWGSS